VRRGHSASHLGPEEKRLSYLWSAVAVVGIVSGLNLVLTMAVIRRMRDAGAPPAPITAGERVELSGELTGASLFGFFSPSCGACKDQLPGFVRRARGHVAVAIITGTPTEAVELEKELGGVARIVVEPLDGPVARAFGVRMWPVFAVVDAGGTVLASATSLDGLPVPVAV
jgi:hypothetical protein